MQNLPETQREYYERILKDKDCQIRILEMVITELTKWIEFYRPFCPTWFEEEHIGYGKHGYLGDD